MSYRIIDLCRNKLLGNLKVLSSYKLDTPIRWVNIAELAENPQELVNGIKNNDLIVIRGPFLKNDPQILRSVLENAVQAHAAAILLYPNALDGGIPEEILTYAKKNEFPLLEMACRDKKALPLADLSSVITKEITTKNFLAPKFFSQIVLQDILCKDFYGDQTIFLAHASSLGFDLQIPLQAVVVSAKRLTKKKNARSANSINADQNMLTEKLPAAVDHELSHYYFNQPYLSGVIQNKYVLLLPNSLTNYPIKKIGKLIMAACLKMENSAEYSFSVAIGSLGETLEEFSDSIQEALQILDIMQIIQKKNDVKHINDVILSMIVKNLKQDKYFVRLYDICILPLIEMDKAEKFDLLKSLITYFDCGKNISLAANELFLHRNTMKNRLDKIEDLLSKKLDDPFDCLELQLALHYYRMNFEQ